MKRVFVILALSLTVATQYVMACSCMPIQSVEEAISSASAIVSGRVVAVRLVSRVMYILDNKFNIEDLVVTIDVDNVWKGSVKESIEVTTAFEATACGFPFSIGNSYLLYLHTTDSHYGVSFCGRSTSMSPIPEDLAVLGEPSHRYHPND